VTLAMAMFGIGAGAPLVLLGTLSRQAMTRIRGKLLAGGNLGKQVLGAAMVAARGDDSERGRQAV